MRLIGLLLTALLLLLLVLFAISNPAPVALQLWPFDLSWEVPLAGAVLGAAALFFALGALLAWGGALRYRLRARKMQRAAQLLEAELADLRKKQDARPAASASTALAPTP
ncbi:lipopolysaccharide assembly protein LapA domain-containing protein [Pseudoroseomonas globiformis]|uniref:Lipopolysaccharide assembly protein LapA domain-containing protein n=1 Tax=Teichococcus globiformis TaxID=2307229 RepID=A0ABV7G222_9PROT